MTAASRRSGLEFNERSPAEQAEDFFYRRFHHTLKVTCTLQTTLLATGRLHVRRHTSLDIYTRTSVICPAMAHSYMLPAVYKVASFWAQLDLDCAWKVDKAVVAALASALEETPEAGPAALKAAVRRHAIVEVQVGNAVPVRLLGYKAMLHCDLS